MEFDDEQIADDKCVANMNFEFDELKTNFVKTQAQSKNDKVFFEVGNLLKKADKLFEFEKQKQFGELADFVSELKKVNLLELEDLKTIYTPLKDIDKQPPKFVSCPANLAKLGDVVAKNELLILEKLCEICFEETNSNSKQVLEAIIKRRLKSLLDLFFNSTN